MQDFLLVKVLESRHNLPEVVSDFWLCQHLSCFQDVSHGLGREGGGGREFVKLSAKSGFPLPRLVVPVDTVGE